MSVSVGQRLAVDGGRPVRDRAVPWPRWPVAAPGAERNVLQVLHGDRWALTGPIRSSELFERRFAREFAAWVGSRHCVPVDHGSSALVVALESLGLEFGDRVLVPALTWTASATAALRAGLVPVLVDVNPVTGCLDVDGLDASVGARAAVVVHWSLTMADMPALLAAAGPAGIELVEDCAQAHGAAFEGRTAGTWARLGCFSTQQGKVLSAGEGGAVVTDEADLAVRLQELRADSRSYRPDVGAPGELETVESATVMGSNFCLGELGAALLCAQLEVIDEQQAHRARSYRHLSALVDDIPGVRLHAPDPRQTAMSIYELPIVFDELPPGVTSRRLAEILTAELGTEFYLTDEPLGTSRLLRPWTKSTMRPLAEEFIRCNQGRRYPHAEFFGTQTVVTHHSTLLGTEADMESIGSALRKVTAALW